MSWLEFSTLFRDLFEAYIYRAWPFALLHVGILAVLIHDLYRLRLERRVLSRYQKASSESKKDELAAEGGLARVFRQFERESERLGRQGLIAPMTDFSDRLDAEVEQKVSRVYDYAGLLLTIGIAGTMFGVFEFAFRAGGVLGGGGASATAELSGFLAESMAKAFPVGVMGLFWMLAAQVVASRFERKLQQAVSQTAMQVLGSRAQHITSSAEQIEKSAERIEQVAQSIERGLEPIRDLKGTIKEGVTPIVEELGKQLQEAVGVIEQQSAEMRKTNERVTTGMTEIVENTRSVVEDMREETSQLKKYLQGIPEVVEQTEGLQSRQQEILAAIDDSQEQLNEVHAKFNRVVGTLQATSEALEALPERFEEAHLEAASVAQRKAVETWQANYKELESGLQDVHEDFLREIRTHIEAVEQKTTKLPEEVGKAADELNRVARAADEVMNEKFMGAVREALGVAEQQIDEKLLDRYPEAVEQVDRLAASLNETAEWFEYTGLNFERALRQATDAFEDIDSFEERMERLVGSAIGGDGEPIGRQMKSMVDEVRAIRANLSDSRAGSGDPTPEEQSGKSSETTTRQTDSPSRELRTDRPADRASEDSPDGEASDKPSMPSRDSSSSERSERGDAVESPGESRGSQSYRDKTETETTPTTRQFRSTSNDLEAKEPGSQTETNSDSQREDIHESHSQEEEPTDDRGSSIREEKGSSTSSPGETRGDTGASSKGTPARGQDEEGSDRNRTEEAGSSFSDRSDADDNPESEEKSSFWNRLFGGS